MELGNIKYYPDRFYIKLDEFDLNNLTSFLHEKEISQDQSVFIHEYYHYLTNITSFSGIRQFHLNFCDRFRLITILTSKKGLSAFPLNKNGYPECNDEIDYWNTVSDILKEDDIDYDLVQDTENSQNKSFEIQSVEKVRKAYSNGERVLVKLEIGGLTNRSDFNLTFGALDEFLSSSIDEYLFENDFSDIDPRHLGNRPFYPYRFFDKLLSYYGIERPSSLEKILTVYIALNSFNPPLKLIELLENLKDGGYEEFQNNPEEYLKRQYNETSQYENLLNHIDSFAKETEEQGRVHISQALKYYYDKFLAAQKLKEQDLFYFIRPFFHYDNKINFLKALARILNHFTPPVILQQKQFYVIDKLTNFGELTLMILATYEIFESVKNQIIAKRPKYLKLKYNFPDQDYYCDVIETFNDLPKKGSSFHLALNELSLFKLYLEEKDKREAANNG